MAQFIKHFVQDLQQDIKIRQCGTIVFNKDNLSNVITVDLYNGQEEYSGGGSVAGACICPDGSTVPLTGSIDGKTASVTLTGDCFAFPGQIGIGVQVVSGTIKTTVLKAIYNVELFETDDVIDPGSRITASVGQLVADIEAATAEIPASDMASLMSGIAPTFSATTNYAAGAYVYYSGALYRFTNAHAAGSWTGTDATAVVLGNDVSDLKGKMNDQRQTYNLMPKELYLSTSQRGNPAIINGVTYTVQPNGEIIATGTASAGSTYYFSSPNTSPIALSAGAYVFILNSDVSNYARVRARKSDESSWTMEFTTAGSRYVFESDVVLTTGITVTKDVVLPNDGILVQPMIYKESEGYFGYIAPWASLANYVPEIIERVNEQTEGLGTLNANITDINEKIAQIDLPIHNLFKNKNGEKIIDSGTWGIGSVTTSGIDPTAQNNIHSGLFTIGNYDYVDVALNYYEDQRKIWFIVYRYKDNVYSLAEYTNDKWIKDGCIRLTDKSYSYIIRVRKDDNTNFTQQEFDDYKQLIDVSGGYYNTVCYAENIKTVLGGIFKKTIDEPYILGSFTSAGYGSNTNNTVTLPFSVSNCDYLKIDASNISGCRYSVYSYDGENYVLVSGGWTTDDFEITDLTKMYVIRIEIQNVSELTIAQFATCCNALKIYGVINLNNYIDYFYGYSRDYTDITRTLQFERKSISTSGIADSTVSLLAELPNNGTFECRLNKPIGKFSVWKKSGSTYTCLSADWTYYQYRYTGNDTAKYYIAVATPDNGEITLNEYNTVMVLQYNDIGENHIISTGLYHKTIAVFGDSIVQGRMSKNGTSVNTTVLKPYSNLLSEIAGTEPNNFGVGGATVANSPKTSYPTWKSLYTRQTDVAGFDVVFICAGINDYGADNPEADFRSAYGAVLDTLIANNTEVVCLTNCARSTNATNDVGLRPRDYAAIEKEIAEAKGIRVIDLFTLTDNASFKAQLPDGLHPNEIGHRMIADLVLKYY